MALIRCTQCNTPLTDDEIASGACPLCALAIAPRAAAAAAPPPPQPTVTGPSPTQTALFLVCGALVFCLLPFGIIFYATLPDKPQADPEAAKKEAPPLLAKLTPKKEPAKKNTEEPKQPEPPPEEKSLSKEKEPPEPEKKIEPKKEEPKVEVKKVEPKKEEPKVEVKKIEPKQEEPKVIVKKVEPKQEPMPEPIKLANAYLPLLTDDLIRIDGDLADWRDMKPQFLMGLERGKSPKKAVVVPKTQKAYFAYSPRGILVAVDVVDTSGALENVPREGKSASKWAFWDNDAVEIYIDTLNRRPRHRGEPSAHQFIAFPFGANDPGVGGYESRILGSAWSVLPLGNVGKNAMLSAGKKTPTGWTLEMLIPKSALRHGDLKPGQIVGFEVQIDTGTNVFYHWSNDNPDVRVSTNPSSWGEIALAGTDAKIEGFAKGGEPVQMLSPGEPVHLRITDLDSNLDPAVREMRSVTVLAKSGDRMTLDLEETTPNSGVFEGVLATKKKTRSVRGALALEPDDIIAIEYIDRVRANGTRNLPVRAEIAVKAR